MRFKMIVVFLFILGTIPVATLDAAKTQEELTVITLPEGNATAGRKAFTDLRCFTCHNVAGEKEMQKAWSANQGPELSNIHAKQNSGRLASSILAPSHTVDEETRKKMTGQLSPMGDFSEAMTVRQLLDLIAYIHSLR